MSKTEIRLHLRELHDQLAVINDDLKTTERIDEETIDALGQLVSDVVSLSDKAHDLKEAGDLSEEHEVLDQILKFQSRHPRVVQILSQMTDALAMMGI